MFVFSNAKAGMQGVDKDKVNRVIYEMSKNSSYFKQAQLQDKKVDGKVKIDRFANCRLNKSNTAFREFVDVSLDRKSVV